MRPVRRILLAFLGVGLIGAAVGEHLYRRLIERRYRQEITGRQQLERRFNEVVITHDQLISDLAKERQRSQELSAIVKEKSEAFEQTVGRLSEETQTIRELQLRLAAMEQQMDHLQGELATALQQSGSANEGKAGAVELERIVVAKADAPMQGRVVSVHPDWDFVIIDLGWDEVNIGDTVSIFRSDQLLAKARVERVQEGVAAATLLPEWKSAKIQVNDRVQLL